MDLLFSFRLQRIGKYCCKGKKRAFSEKAEKARKENEN